MRKFFRRTASAVTALAVALAVPFVLDFPSVAENSTSDGREINEDNFPDDVFRQYVLDNYDKNKDRFLSNSEANGIIIINVPSKGISDLKGIEFFSNLRELNFSSNNVQTLNIRKNTSLVNLHGSDNELTSIDISKNPCLKGMWLQRNSIEYINVENNSELETLWLGGNCLTQIDVSKNPKLNNLGLSGSQLESLDISNNTELEYLYLTDCGLETLDVSNNTKLLGLDCDENYLEELDLSGNPLLTTLQCGYNNLKELDLTNNTELVLLNCEENEITSLDLKNNRALTELVCPGNGMKKLDVGGLTELSVLECQSNELTVLDVRSNTNLTILYGWYNRLTSIDVSQNTMLDATDNDIFNVVKNNYPIGGCGGEYDLSRLPEGFDLSKAGYWEGASCKNGILTDFTSDTVRYWYNCGGGRSIWFYLTVTPHELTHVESKDPTCTDNGVKEHWSCSVCGKNFTDEDGTQQTDDCETGALGHSCDDDWKSDDNNHWHECIRCHDRAESTAHEWDEGTVTAEPTEDTDGEKTFKCTVCEKTKTEAIPATGENNPNDGSITKDIQRGENAPKTEFAMPLEELIKAVLTEDEQNAVKDGVDIKIILTVNDAGNSVSAEDKAVVENAIAGLADYKLGQYLDVNLLKLIGNEQRKISATSSPITVRFEVPEVLRGAGRTYVVIRVHNGNASVLADTDYDANTVTIQTDKFSTYALAYRENNNSNPSGNPSNSDDNSSVGESNSDISNSDTASSGSSPSNSDNNSSTGDGNSDSAGDTSGSDNNSSPSANNPYTGSDFPAAIYLTIGSVSIIVFVLLCLFTGKNGMTEEQKERKFAKLIAWGKRGGKARAAVALAVILLLLSFYYGIGMKTSED